MIMTDVVLARIHFYSCQHSKIALEQTVSKFCMCSLIRLTSVPAVKISAVGHVTLSSCAITVYIRMEFEVHFSLYLSLVICQQVL